MKVLFLTLVEFTSLQEHNIYADLLREFIKNGHDIYVISPVERRKREKTRMIRENHAVLLRLLIGNTQKTHIIEKGISTLLLEPQFKTAIRKYYSNVKFDLILYSTPPITLAGAIEYVKKRDGAQTYLLLKDIFPQNAVDIGLMKTTGLKGLIYKHFRKQEKRLYSISDFIGCMSQANVEYVIKHNPELDVSRVKVCPNSLEVIDKSVDEKMRLTIRAKYKIPSEKKVFVYGGNLGKPQGIPFLVECLKKSVSIKNSFFLIVGDGTEFRLIQEYIENEKPENVQLMTRIPKEDYDTMVGACDVGLIFLDHRFTIPNFPSRLLSYMAAKLPVLAVTDPNTDIGALVTGINKAGKQTHDSFGWWCESNDADRFVTLVKECINTDITRKGKVGYRYLKEMYSVEDAYKTIVREVGVN